jgi:NADPH:quinone reductase-like Zn-dependent oxidoreductase
MMSVPDGPDIPEVMRAAFVTAPGPPESIVIGELPVPVPGPADVLVAVEAVAVNQVDTHVRAGRWPTPMAFPFVVGRDLVGTVAWADQAGLFRLGERVWSNSLGYAGRPGATAQYAVVAADRLYRWPRGLPAEATVACLHPAATAYLGLWHRAKVRAGDTVLVGGAAGSIGRCVLALASAAGMRVVATARPSDHELCRRLGAAEVFDYQDPDLVSQVLSVVPDGVDLHWDTSGRGELSAAIAMARPGGQVLIIAGRDTQPPTSLWPMYTKDLSVTGFVISRATSAELASAARGINAQLSLSGFEVDVRDVLPLERTAEAHARLEAGQTGRLVIQVGWGFS